MLKRKENGDETPELLTNQIADILKKELKNYDGYSNAYLATIPEYIENPVWAMNLYAGVRTHYAIVEEVYELGASRPIYIYCGGTKPKNIIDIDQTYERYVMRDGKCCKQLGKIFSNERMEPCIRWDFVS